MNCGFPGMNCNKKWMIYVPIILSIGHRLLRRTLQLKIQYSALR